MAENQTGEGGILPPDQPTVLTKQTERQSLMEQGYAFAKDVRGYLGNLARQTDSSKRVKTIRAELKTINGLIGEQGSTWWKDYFNNFYAKLPNTNPKANFFSDRQTAQPRWNVPFGQRMPSGSGHSGRYLSNTPAQFYQEIDQIIAAEGISVKSIQDLQDKQIDGKTATEKMRAILQLCNLTLPVFIRLILAGYNRFDLTV